MSIPPTNFEPGRIPNLNALTWLRGSAGDVMNTGRRLKLAVLIQPNCPGCMMHALPVGNTLWRKSKRAALGQPINPPPTEIPNQQPQPQQRNAGAPGATAASTPNSSSQLIEQLFSSLDVYCVSTAFEDFEYNNLQSTQLLLDGQHVGESLTRLGATVRPQCQPVMPVAFDVVIDKPNAPTQLLDLALHSSKESARKRLGTIVPKEELDAHFAKVGHEILPAQIPAFFYCAAANGTPSWVLHTDDGKHLDTLFGWISEAELIDWMIAQAQKSGL